MWLPCFCFPAVPHFNKRHLRVTCSTSRARAATSTAPSTYRLFSRTWRTPSRLYQISPTTHERNSSPGSSPSHLRREHSAPNTRNGAPCPWPAPGPTGRHFPFRGVRRVKFKPAACEKDGGTFLLRFIADAMAPFRLGTTPQNAKYFFVFVFCKGGSRLAKT
jgi:hypothetical protein